MSIGAIVGLFVGYGGGFGQFKEDIDLHLEVSEVEVDLAISTYMIARMVAADAYSSSNNNLTLPYSSYNASLTPAQLIQQIEA